MSARSSSMSTVTEDDEEEDDNEEPNETKDPSDNVIIDTDRHHPTTSIKVMTASEKLSSACFAMVIRNSCKQVNCEYSHDKAIIAAARDKQIADLTAAKRAMQDGHQATMKIFEKAGAKAFRSASAQPVERRPVATDTSPRFLLLQQPLGSQLNEEVGREAECFHRVAAMTQRFPASILKQGCQTEVTILCIDRDITIHTTLDTGCSPNNYLSAEYFNRNVEALSPFLVSSIPERVDLATSGSTQPITAHVVLDLRHVDDRGRIRLMKLKFGILKGLLALQLEFLKSGSKQHLSVLHGQVPQLLMLSSDDTDASSN